MFERFIDKFRLLPSGQVPGPLWRDGRLLASTGYAELAGRFAGCSFENGIYRLHDAETGPRGRAWIAESFPMFASRACPFAYDWLGRQFAVDSGRLEGDEPLVLLLEPGTGEVLEIPFSFPVFHEQLDELREPALAESFFASWVKVNPSLLPLRATQCVGYKVPLFLGGKDTLENLEVIDLEVYWSMSGQLRQGTRSLRQGTSIGSVRRDRSLSCCSTHPLGPTSSRQPWMEFSFTIPTPRGVSRINGSCNWTGSGIGRVPGAVLRVTFFPVCGSMCFPMRLG